MNAPLSPAAMLVRAGMMHDDGECPMDAIQSADFWRVFAIMPGDNEDALIDAALAELAGDPGAPCPAPAPILATIHGQAVMIHLHDADGEYHWSATHEDGELCGTGTDFHATPDEARADAVQVLEVVLSPEWHDAYSRAA